MGFNKTLISLVLTGALTFGIGVNTKADINITLNKPIEFYDDFIFGNGKKLPDDTRCLFEQQSIRAGVHVYDDLGIENDLSGVYTILGINDMKAPSVMETLYPNGLEADYLTTLTIEPITEMYGHSEIFIQAFGNSGFSNKISLGDYYINMTPEPTTLSLFGLGALALLKKRKK